MVAIWWKRCRMTTTQLTVTLSFFFNYHLLISSFLSLFALIWSSARDYKMNVIKWLYRCKHLTFPVFLWLGSWPGPAGISSSLRLCSNPQGSRGQSSARLHLNSGFFASSVLPLKCFQQRQTSKTLPWGFLEHLGEDNVRTVLHVFLWQMLWQIHQRGGSKHAWLHGVIGKVAVPAGVALTEDTRWRWNPKKPNSATTQQPTWTPNECESTLIVVIKKTQSVC